MAYHVSRLLQIVPSDLGICQAAATDREIKKYREISKRYQPDLSTKAPEGARLRAFRLIEGMSRYLEIGTFTKASLRYAMHLLDPAAVVVDLDVKENPAARTLLESDKPKGQTYHCVVGDSTETSTLDAVKSAAGDEAFDAVFIDANHVARYVMSDFALYGELVSTSGYVLFHDVQWEGNANAKGVVHTLEVLQRFVPVFQVLTGQPVTHWYPPLLRRPDLWGGFAIIRGEDLHKAMKR